MKFRILSDLHLEGFKFNYEPEGEDVLVLAGDITTRGRHEEFLKTVPEDIEVVFVAGNHEYYRSEFSWVNLQLKALEKKFKNFHFLNNSKVTIGGIDFFGGTMFTDLTLENPGKRSIAKIMINNSINDFGAIRTLTPETKERIWTIDDHISEFKKFKKALVKFFKGKSTNKKVVVTHFMPSPQMIDPAFAGSLLNSYFCVNMEEYMGFDGVWVCGHTHSSSDIMIGKTRVVCNPKGYGSENPQFKEDLIIEI